VCGNKIARSLRKSSLHLTAARRSHLEEEEKKRRRGGGGTSIELNSIMFMWDKKREGILFAFFY
jgi:hypothetical protein